jgi:SNF2 family DNA or RNA helicase
VITGDVRLARRRSYVLHRQLQGIVLRRDISILGRDLPPKYEFVINCKLSPLQLQCYRAYIQQIQDKKNKIASSSALPLLTTPTPTPTISNTDTSSTGDVLVDIDGMEYDVGLAFDNTTSSAKQQQVLEG